MKKVLNKNKIFYLIMFILITIVLVITGLKAYNEFFKRGENTEVIQKNEIDSLELYGYTLDDLDTEVYKKYFEELKEVLNSEDVNLKEYASSIVKLFVTDFYTLNNKISSSDFGGEEFIHPDLIANFELNAGDTMYNHVKANFDGKREQSLPEVSEVTIESVDEASYSFAGVEHEAFKVKAVWSYKEDLGYETSGLFYVVKDENKLYIVEK